MNARTTTNIDEIVEVIKNGGVVVFPTETSYGIGCDATNPEAVERVMRLKNRPEGMSMALIVRDDAMAQECGSFTEVEKMLTDRHWPGPLTVILHNANEKLPKHCVMNDAVGVRVSSHPVAHGIVEKFGRPIIATSANVHGQESSYNLDTAIGQFGDHEDAPDLYFDAGELERRPSSMIIEVVNGEIVVHRKGSFKL